MEKLLAKTQQEKMTPKTAFPPEKKQSASAKMRVRYYANTTSRMKQATDSKRETKAGE